MLFEKKKVFPTKLTIALVARNFPILGRSSDHGFLWPIARGLAHLGHKIMVIAARSNLGKSEISRDGVHAFFLQEGDTSNVTFEDMALKKFIELHKQTPFDIVHSIDNSAIRISESHDHFRVAIAYDADATQMGQIVSILGMGQETVGGILSTSIAMLYKFLTTYYGGDRQLLRSAHGVFVTSPQQRLILERYYLYPDFHIYTVPYGLDIGNLAPRQEDKDLREELSLPMLSQIVVTVSDMTEVDEMAHLLRAFERVAIKKPNAYLIILGSGPKWKEIEYEVLSHALSRRVRMVGAVKDQDLTNYISLGDIFVNLSSRTTGFEASIIEAMAQQKVVVGSEVSAMANIIEDHINGFLLRPADIPSLAHLLIDIFSDQIPVDEIGKHAREKVVGLFDSERMVTATLDAYYRILENSGFYQRPRLDAKMASP